MTDHCTKSIVQSLGADRIAAALGVSPQTVRVAQYDGRFPASWALVLREMCGGAGIDCPDALFNFKPPLSEVSRLPPKAGTHPEPGQ